MIADRARRVRLFRSVLLRSRRGFARILIEIPFHWREFARVLFGAPLVQAGWMRSVLRFGLAMTAGTSPMPVRKISTDAVGRIGTGAGQARAGAAGQIWADAAGRRGRAFWRRGGA